jgi:lipopolysaccharide/colanic/teichoic acid biosynthesis glycosyltransferase
MRRRGDRPYRGKRLVDVAVLLATAPAALVIGATCAIAIRAESTGPVFFRQVRTGQDGRAFEVVKFRTMIDRPNPVFPDPSRITRVGRWLRRTSLDELPQLINVARGEMSIVGPRPALAYQVERYDRRQRRRLAVRPGITGLAQVRGRNGLAWARRIELDLEYLATQGPLTDLRILWSTAAAVISGAGVGGHPTDDPIATPPDT